jgi:hypothetical protein
MDKVWIYFLYRNPVRSAEARYMRFNNASFVLGLPNFMKETFSLSGDLGAVEN